LILTTRAPRPDNASGLSVALAANIAWSVDRLCLKLTDVLAAEM
jgi:hypothetical protein